MANPFEIIGITRTSTLPEAKAAYRSLAKRWHPDRFAAGPEREWALTKMTEINVAYRECVKELSSPGSAPGVSSDERAAFSDVQSLISLNQLSVARQALLRIATRTAEWNYLFGAILFRQGEFEKSILYFQMAQRQAPGNAQYRAALRSAQTISARKKGSRIIQKILAPLRRNAK